MARPSAPTSRRFAAPLACALAAGGAVVGTPALAQASVSHAVVQPTASPSLTDLNAALKDLSRDPGNVPALVRAGWASLGIDDTQAASGFFRRAQALQPLNGEVRAGLASVSLRMGDPVAAVRQFTEAEAAGIPMARYAADRGLALDLVGNNSAAQALYRQALAFNPDPEVTRRLALSQAIAGDDSGSEATLLPLMQRRDLAAYRTRAFALAILGRGEEAVSIAQTMLPAQISSRLAPYLRYMPRLTRAQQAAAANLGQFPPAAEIGRDDPQIAALSAAARPVQVASATPDSRLVPSGQPLGPGSRKSASSRNDKRNEQRRSRNSKDKGSVEVSYAPLPKAQSPVPPPPPVPAAIPAPTPTPAPPPAIAPSQPVAPRILAAAPPTTSQPATSQPARDQLPESKPVVVSSLEPLPSAAPPPPAVEEAPRPSLSISQPPPPKPVSLADAFADFATLPVETKRESGTAVDISRIKPAREPAKADAKQEQAKTNIKAKPKPPAEPARFWVQVGTGRDVKALGFTWRKVQKQNAALLAKHDAYSARWGATRRLLTGPYKSEDEADKAVSALKKKGIDAFEFTSDEGQEVTPLK